MPPAPAGKDCWPWKLDSRPSAADSVQPRITIVTPSYNQADFLEETIRSVILQGYTNLEYIVIDGASTDESVSIIRRYEPWLSFWTSEPDSGQSHAINKGWRRATGDLLAWVNSDDLLAPSALANVSGAYSRFPGASIYTGYALGIDERGRAQGSKGWDADIIEAFSEARNPFVQSSTYVTRAALENCGVLDESLHFSMDWDLWIRIGLRHDVQFIPEILSYSRSWPGAKTARDRLGSAREHVRIVQNLCHTSGDNPRLSRLQRRATASAYSRSAVLHYESGKTSKAIALFFLALMRSPVAAIRRLSGKSRSAPVQD